MNIFDFDKTIFDGDSTFRFLMFCAKRSRAVRRTLWRTAVYGLGYLTRTVQKQRFKEVMFRFLTKIDVEAELAAFWDCEISRIKPWYAAMHRGDDLVISASPLFLVKPACARIGIGNVLGSPVDPHTGKYTGKNCHGEEKVTVFSAAYPDAVCGEFYSDSYSDTPMARLAEKAVLVKGNRLLAWKKK